MPSESPQKSHAVIYLENYLKRALGGQTKGFKIQAGAQVVQYEDLKFCAELVVQLILSPYSSKVHKGRLQMSLEIILFQSQKLFETKRGKKKSKQEHPSLIKEVFAFISKSFLETLTERVLVDILTIIGAIVKSCQSKILLIEILAQCQKSLIEVFSITQNELSIQISIVKDIFHKSLTIAPTMGSLNVIEVYNL